jgi:hypothetical protein
MPQPSPRRRTRSPHPGYRSGSEYLTVNEMALNTSGNYCILMMYLVVAITAIEYMRPDRNNIVLSLAIDVTKVGIVGCFLFHITHLLRHRSTSRPFLQFFLEKMPLVVGSSTELLVAVGLFKSGKASSAGAFVIGSAYAKPLVIGALYLVSQGIRTRQPRINTLDGTRSSTIRYLAYGGLLLFASATKIEGRFEISFEWLELTSSTEPYYWIYQGLFAIIISFVFYLTSGRDSKHIDQATDADGFGFRQEGWDDSNDWVILVLSLTLIGAKAYVVSVINDLLEHVLALTSNREASVYFTVLPLVAIAVDHAPACQPDIATAWTNLIQSTLANFFIIRQLAVLAGHDVAPTDGQRSLGICLILTAALVSIPRLPSKYAMQKQ